MRGLASYFFSPQPGQGWVRSTVQFLVTQLVWLPVIAALMLAGGIILYVLAWLFGPFGEVMTHWLGNLG